MIQLVRACEQLTLLSKRVQGSQVVERGKVGRRKAGSGRYTGGARGAAHAVGARALAVQALAIGAAVVGGFPQTQGKAASGFAGRIYVVCRLDNSRRLLDVNIVQVDLLFVNLFLPLPFQLRLELLKLF